jgi:four helix bundle protein
MPWIGSSILSANATGDAAPPAEFKMENRQPRTGQRELRGDALAERLVDFAVQIIALASRLPKDAVGRHIASQMVESGTSVGAHYEEARGAESKADFVHKLGIALKECRETRYWLRVVERAKMVADDVPSELFSEAAELCAILGQSILTAKGRKN